MPILQRMRVCRAVRTGGLSWLDSDELCERSAHCSTLSMAEHTAGRRAGRQGWPITRWSAIQPCTCGQCSAAASLSPTWLCPPTPSLPQPPLGSTYSARRAQLPAALHAPTHLLYTCPAPPSTLAQVSEAAIKQAQRAEKEAEKMKGLIRARFDFLDDMS